MVSIRILKESNSYEFIFRNMYRVGKVQDENSHKCSRKFTFISFYFLSSPEYINLTCIDLQISMRRVPWTGIDHVNKGAASALVQNKVVKTPDLAWGTGHYQVGSWSNENPWRSQGLAVGTSTVMNLSPSDCTKLLIFSSPFQEINIRT